MWCVGIDRGRASQPGKEERCVCVCVCVSVCVSVLWERERVGRFGRMALKHVNIMYEMSCQSRFDARYWMLGAGALGRPRGMNGEGGGFRMGPRASR